MLPVCLTLLSDAVIFSEDLAFSDKTGCGLLLWAWLIPEDLTVSDETGRGLLLRVASSSAEGGLG